MPARLSAEFCLRSHKDHRYAGGLNANSFISYLAPIGAIFLVELKSGDKHECTLMEGGSAPVGATVLENAWLRCDSDPNKPISTESVAYITLLRCDLPSAAPKRTATTPSEILALLRSLPFDTPVTATRNGCEPKTWYVRPMPARCSYRDKSEPILCDRPGSDSGYFYTGFFSVTVETPISASGTVACRDLLNSLPLGTPIRVNTNDDYDITGFVVKHYRDDYPYKNAFSRTKDGSALLWSSITSITLLDVAPGAVPSPAPVDCAFAERPTEDGRGPTPPGQDPSIMSKTQLTTFISYTPKPTSEQIQSGGTPPEQILRESNTILVDSVEVALRGIRVHEIPALVEKNKIPDDQIDRVKINYMNLGFSQTNL